MRADRALLAFAASVFVFHHLPALVGDLGDWVDLATPVVVVLAAAAALAAAGAAAVAGARLPLLALTVVAGVLYVDGHGIHLAANSIARERLTGEGERVAHFWDERFGHIEWHLGWIGLIAALCLAEAEAAKRTRTGRPLHGVTASLTVGLLGFTLFTGTVEGETWWLMPPAAALFGAWALRRPRPLLLTCAAAFALAALLIGAWAAWQRSVPEFSEVGFL